MRRLFLFAYLFLFPATLSAAPGEEAVTEHKWNPEGSTLYEMMGIDDSGTALEDAVQGIKRTIIAQVTAQEDKNLIDAVWALLKQPDFGPSYDIFLEIIGEDRSIPGAGKIHCQVWTEFYKKFKIRGWEIHDRLWELANYLENHKDDRVQHYFNPETLQRIRLYAARTSLQRPPLYSVDILLKSALGGAAVHSIGEVTLYRLLDEYVTGLGDLFLQMDDPDRLNRLAEFIERHEKFRSSFTPTQIDNIRAYAARLKKGQHSGWRNALANHYQSAKPFIFVGCAGIIFLAGMQVEHWRAHINPTQRAAEAFQAHPSEVEAVRAPNEYSPQRQADDDARRLGDEFDRLNGGDYQR